VFFGIKIELFVYKQKNKLKESVNIILKAEIFLFFNLKTYILVVMAYFFGEVKTHEQRNRVVVGRP
jgi:hypothetical protein